MLLIKENAKENAKENTKETYHSSLKMHLLFPLFQDLSKAESTKKEQIKER